MTFDMDRFLANRERHRRRMTRLYTVALVLAAMVLLFKFYNAVFR